MGCGKARFGRRGLSHLNLKILVLRRDLEWQQGGPRMAAGGTWNGSRVQHQAAAFKINTLTNMTKAHLALIPVFEH